MTGKGISRYRWNSIREKLTDATFWWTLIGILGALLVWFYLFYLAIKYLDTSLAMHSTFCSSEAQRNRHILLIILMTPLFLVGMLGVIGEWMALMESRRGHRQYGYKPLIGFSILMQLAAIAILMAMRC